MADSLTAIVDNSDKILEEFNKQIKKGLAAIGLTAEKYAKGTCPVDTGRLRNSITYATADKHDAGSGTYHGKKGKGGTADPKDWEVKATPESVDVYIGTNVEYARGIEEGTHRSKGAAHFLKNAAANHGDEYKKLMEEALKK